MESKLRFPHSHSLDDYGALSETQPTTSPIFNVAGMCEKYWTLPVTLKLLMALLKPGQGKIWVDRDEMTGLREAELSKVRRKMGFLFQDAAPFDSLSLYENLALPL